MSDIFIFNIPVDISHFYNVKDLDKIGKYTKLVQKKHSNGETNGNEKRKKKLYKIIEIEKKRKENKRH